MGIATSYDLSIPRDALTDVETAGPLGESFVSIDVSQSNGPPIENYGYLQSKPTRRPLSFEEEIRAARALLELQAADKASQDSRTGSASVSTQKSKP